MPARVTTITGSHEQAEQGIAAFRDTTLPAIKEAGGSGGVLLIDRESGKAMAITLWEDERLCGQVKSVRTSYDELPRRNSARPTSRVSTVTRSPSSRSRS